mmetsp:Transcript_5276/g.14616  ORF Transcript_5276/g.14616 Transcript_5276/m.14616 type:complete len:286 (+) Transcript_5276:101-958(+)
MGPTGKEGSGPSGPRKVCHHSGSVERRSGKGLSHPGLGRHRGLRRKDLVQVGPYLPVAAALGTLANALLQLATDALLATTAAGTPLHAFAVLLQGVGVHRRHQVRGEHETFPAAHLADAGAQASGASYRHPPLPLPLLLQLSKALALLLFLPHTFTLQSLLQLPLLLFAPLSLLLFSRLTSQLSPLLSPLLPLRLPQPLLAAQLLFLDAPALEILHRTHFPPLTVAADEVNLLVGCHLPQRLWVVRVRDLFSRETELPEVEGRRGHERRGAPRLPGPNQSSHGFA